MSGPSVRSGRIRLDVLKDLADSLQAAVTRLGLASRGEPTVRRGRRPAEIADLTRLELVGVQEGSTVLELRLAEQARPLLDQFDPGIRALDSLADGLAALGAGTKPPPLWDAGVTDAVGLLSRLFEQGVDELGFEHVADERRSVTFTRQTATRLVPSAPRAAEGQRVEIEGRLLMADFAAPREKVRIHRPGAAPVTCTFPPALETIVLRLLRRYVRGTGTAIMAGGGLREVVLESIEDAEPASGRTFWDLPTLDELAEEQGVEPVERIEDLVADFWPDDESVDDFLAAIESRD